MTRHQLTCEHRERDRETERQSDRETERQSDRATERQKESNKETKTQRHKDRKEEREKETKREREKERAIETETESYNQTHKERERARGRRAEQRRTEWRNRIWASSRCTAASSSKSAAKRGDKPTGVKAVSSILMQASTKMQHREAESYGRSVPLLPCAGMFAKPSSCALEQNAGMARNGYNILLEC